MKCLPLASPFEIRTVKSLKEPQKNPADSFKSHAVQYPQRNHTNLVNPLASVVHVKSINI